MENWMRSETVRASLERVARAMLGNFSMKLRYGTNTHTDCATFIELNPDRPFQKDERKWVQWILLSADRDHEVAHMFTQIDDKRRTAEAYSDPIRARIAADVFNILEDGRVEHLLAIDLPGTGPLLKFSNEFEFERFPQNETLQRKPVELFVTGLLQKAVVGRYKGAFPDERVNRLLKQAEPLVHKSRYASSSSEVVQISHQIMDLIEPLIEELLKQASEKNQAPDYQPSSKNLDSESGSANPRPAPPKARQREPDGDSLEQSSSFSDSGSHDRVDQHETSSLDHHASSHGSRLSDEEIEKLKALAEAELEKLKHQEQKAKGQAKSLHMEILPQNPRLHGPVRFKENEAKVGNFYTDLDEGRLRNLAYRHEEELKRILREQKRTKNRGRRHHGFLDDRLAYRAVFFNDPNVFRKKEAEFKLDTFVHLLIDISASMSMKSRLTYAVEGAALLNLILGTIKVPHAITAFNAYGGVVYHSLIADRDNCFEHRAVFGRLKSLTPARNNRDGDSIRRIGEYFDRQREKKRILVVVSDGQPNDQGYGGEQAIKDTRNAVTDLERRSVQVIGVSIGDNHGHVPRIYRHNVCLDDVSQLPSKLASIIENVFH